MAKPVRKPNTSYQAVSNTNEAAVSAAFDYLFRQVIKSKEGKSKDNLKNDSSTTTIKN